MFSRSPHHTIRAGSFVQSSLPGFGFLWYDVWALRSAGVALPDSTASPLPAAKRRCPGVQAIGRDRHRGRLESTGHTPLSVNAISVHSQRLFLKYCFLPLCARWLSGSCEHQSTRVRHGPGGGQLGAPSGPKAQSTSGAPPPRQLSHTGVWRHFGINIAAVQQNIDSLPAPEGRSRLPWPHCQSQRRPIGPVGLEVYTTGCTGYSRWVCFLCSWISLGWQSQVELVSCSVVCVFRTVLYWKNSVIECKGSV